MGRVGIWMNKKLKIAIIGSGSTYTPELIEGMISEKMYYQ
jgi:6-phospho-beta-glucosidase